VALVLGFTNNRATRKLQELSDASARARDASQALLEYQFEARKRLYGELGPILFQLSQQSEQAFWRVHGLADSARRGRLYAGSAGSTENRLKEKSKTYLPSTVYRFMAPLASYWLCQRRLTSVDMSLDPEIDMAYHLTRMLYRTWTDGDEIARIDPTQPYKPVQGGRDPSTARQHVSLQKIERLVEAMIVPAAPDTPARVMTLGEFFNEYDNRTSQLFVAAEDVRTLFIDFHPESRPVLWRLLAAQAHLYAALSGCYGTPAHPDPRTMFQEARKAGGPFDWLPEDTPFDPAVNAPIDVACMYLLKQGWAELPWDARSAAANGGKQAASHSIIGRGWARLRTPAGSAPS
jgi:hypothetical protein